MHALRDEVFCSLLVVCSFVNYVYSQEIADFKTHMPTQASACKSFIQSRLILSQNKNKYAASQTYEYTFSSPNYPQRYPNDTKCIKVIEAPSPNHRIVIDFRERFEMEPSNTCQFDYLEIRDGYYGYSPLLGKFCNKFPEMKGIRTTGQSAWLQFYSDKNIDQRGFSAVYYFEEISEKKRDDNLCRLVVDMTKEKEKILRQTYLPVPEMVTDSTKLKGGTSTSSVSNEYDCSFDIFVPSSNYVFLSFYYISFHHENDCDKSFIEFYDGFSVNPMKFTVGEVEVKKLCGPDITNPPRISTRTGRLIVRVVVTAKSKRIPKYKMVINEYNKAEECRKNEFKCGLTNFCIPFSLTCNGHINCPNAEDEVCIDQKVIHHGRLSTEKKFAKTTPQNLEASKKNSYHPYILGCIGGTLIIVCSLWFTISLRHRNREKKKLKDLEIEIRPDGEVRFSNHKITPNAEPNSVPASPDQSADKWANKNHVSNPSKKAQQEPHLQSPPPIHSRPDSSLGSVYYIPKQHDPSVCSMTRNWSQQHVLKHQASDSTDPLINGIQSPSRYTCQTEAHPDKPVPTSDIRVYPNYKKAAKQSTEFSDPMKRIGKYLANSNLPSQSVVQTKSEKLYFTQPTKRSQSSNQNPTRVPPTINHSHSGYLRTNTEAPQYFDYNETEEIKPMYRARSWAGGLKQTAQPTKYFDECCVYYDENIDLQPSSSYNARVANMGFPYHVCSRDDPLLDNMNSDFENMVYEYEA